MQSALRFGAGRRRGHAPGGLPQLHARRIGLHLLRGLLGTTGGLLPFYALSRLPLADAYAIIFATPLLITALSVPILGEAVGWRRWSAVLVGFVGILVMPKLMALRVLLSR